MLRCRVRKLWRWFTITHQVAALVGDDLWDRGVCWGKSGILLASGERGAHNLMDIIVAPIYAGDIWSGIGLVGTNHGAVGGAAAEGRKIGPGSTHVGDIWPDTDVCWRSLVGACVGSVYLVGTNVS